MYSTYKENLKKESHNTIVLCCSGILSTYCTIRVADLHHLDADPDPTFQFNADPDPAPNQSDANPRPLVYTVRPPPPQATLLASMSQM